MDSPKRIDYETKAYHCLTMGCPLEYDIRIASGFYQTCKANIETNKSEKYILCAYPNKA